MLVNRKLQGPDIKAETEGGNSPWDCFRSQRGEQSFEKSVLSEPEEAAFAALLDSVVIVM